MLIDLPKDIANTVAEYEFHEDDTSEEIAEPSKESITRALALMRDSRNPVVYAGGGIGMGNALAEFRAFVEATRIPVVATLKGLGALPTTHELALGMMGMHGTKAANRCGAELRFADLRGRALRRSGHWPAERVRAKRESNSPGCGSRGSQQAAARGRSGNRQPAARFESSLVQAREYRAVASRVRCMPKKRTHGITPRRARKCTHPAF